MKIRVTVLDMQPITPAVGGGRLRLLGLYSALGEDLLTTYVGTYDWPGESARELALTQSLTEITVPLSPEHFIEDDAWRRFAGGETVIDSAFPLLGCLSQAYLERARAAAVAADIVVFSHPWIYPLLSEAIDSSRQLLVYDSHNAEALLKAQLLGDSTFAAELAQSVAMAECFLCRNADFVVGCSQEDIDFFRRSYRVAPERLLVVANGVFAQRILPPAVGARQARKSDLQLSGPVALFLGSNYGPNRTAARFIVESLAPAHPSITFAICGGVGASLSEVPTNVRVSGQLDEAQKLTWLQAADVALNPMFSGSGTNVKMFDFMAAGLPVVSTAVGARGIADVTREGVFVCAPDGLSKQLQELCSNPARRERAGRCNRERVEREYAWETLSPLLGNELRQRWTKRAPVEPIQRIEPRSLKLHAADSGPPAGSQEPSCVGVLSTFGIQCGIAEYASYFVQALRGEGAHVAVFGNRSESQQEGPAAADGAGLAVERVWHFDQNTWTHGDVDQVRLLQVLSEQRISHLNVQYHHAYLSEERMLHLLRRLKQAGVSVSVTLHNSAELDLAFLTQLDREDALMLVHNTREEQRLRAAGMSRVHHVLHGVHSSPAPLAKPSRAPGGPLIATFGFLRPHKGLLELLGAVAILRHIFPSIHLRAQTALYPTPDSAEYLERAVDRVSELSLEQHVTLDSRFLPIDAAIASLAEADMVVLPYAHSDEGSSAAAAAVLAAGRPLVVTKAQIFDEIRSSVYTAQSNEPSVLAVAIATVWANAPLRRHLEACAGAAASEREWPSVARRFLELIAPRAGAPSRELEEHGASEVAPDRARIRRMASS